jgi:hypothetical protein
MIAFVAYADNFTGYGKEIAKFWVVSVGTVVRVPWRVAL